MGEVVQYPNRGIPPPIKVWHDEPAIVLILPVIRIEREPPDEPKPRRRRRD